MEEEGSEVIHVRSPMDDVFAWSETPQTSTKRLEIYKRKCNEDSGYSSSPSCSHSKTRFSIYTVEEGDGCAGDGVAGCTPSAKPKSFLCSKANRKGRCLMYNSGHEVDQFPDLMETSFYSEPMEVSLASPLDSIIEENAPPLCLDSSEESKEIHVDLCKVFTPSSVSLSSRVGLLTPSPLIRRTYSDPLKKCRDLFIPSRRQHLKLSGSTSFDESEKIDFFYHLGERTNHPGIISKILSYLSDRDISSATMVSKTWRNVCMSDLHAMKRWSAYVEDRKQRRENLVPSGGKFKSPRHKRQSPLTTRNHSTPLHVRQPRSPPVSPSKMRFYLFQKEASKLKPDEKLMQCPKCSLPSTCSPTLNLGQCVRIGCQHKFCTVCLSEFHSPKPCLTFKTPIGPRRKPKIGSKESKRFLRRL